MQPAQGILAIIPPLNQADHPDALTAQRDPSDEANARLIAAAPGLLEALQFIAADIEEGVKDRAGWLRISRAAIALAVAA